MDGQQNKKVHLRPLYQRKNYTAQWKWHFNFTNLTTFKSIFRFAS